MYIYHMVGWNQLIRCYVYCLTGRGFVSQLQYVSDVYSKVIFWTTVHMQIPHSSVEKYSYISHIIKQQQQRLTAQHKYHTRKNLFSFFLFTFQTEKKKTLVTEWNEIKSQSSATSTYKRSRSKYLCCLHSDILPRTYIQTYVHTHIPTSPLTYIFQIKRRNEQMNGYNTNNCLTKDPYWWRSW